MWKKEGSFHSRSLGPGVQLFVHPTTKFKTTTLKVYSHHRLDDRASHNALMAFVLRQGTSGHPDAVSISRALEDLYGATLELDVFKLGERQILSAHLEILNDHFAKDRTLFDRGLSLVRDLLFDPLVEGRGFSRRLFEQERHNLIRLIESLTNEKGLYAAERLIEEMCADEPYGIHELGSIDRLQEIENDELFDYHRSRMGRCPIDVYVVGDIDRDRIADRILEALPDGADREELSTLPKTVHRRPRRARRIVEEADIQQARLAIGYRTPIDSASTLGLLYCDAILGGGSASKLFRHLREDAGLAYYAHSGLDRLKGILSVHVGVDSEKLDQAHSIVQRQLSALRRGDVTEHELESARESFLHRARSLEDHPVAMIRSTLVARAIGRPLSARESIARHRQASVEHIAEAAALIRPDTSFFLRRHDSQTTPDELVEQPSAKKGAGERPVAASASGGVPCAS